jgi:hypothetical protein
MGRFDGLKENSFSGKDNKTLDRVQKNKDTRYMSSKVKKNLKEESNKKKVVNVKDKIKEEPIVKVKEEAIVKEESEWIKRIKKNEEKKQENINVNDPRYWNGPNWKGPIFLKQEKTKSIWNNNIKLLNEGKVSAVILPYNKSHYSRDGENWYNSYNETFSIKQLNAIAEYELQRSYDELSDRLIDLHNKRRNESYLNYEMSGEIDSFMWAEIENEKYEKYYEKYEEECEENDKEEELDSDLEYD